MMTQAKDFRTPLARARHLGSAQSGVEHWWLVKITSIALVPLTLWFVYSLITKVVALGGDFNVALDWVKKPYHSFPLALLIWVNFYHAALGGEEIILDYVHGKAQIPSLIIYKFFCYGVAALGIYTVLFITFRM
jgi:succinate dehydrogenase / fumarate reductase membrane anchor subunit